MSLSKYPPSLDLMLAAWNENDQKKMRSLLNNALTDDIHFVDPSINLRGIDAFEQNVLDVQKRLAGAVYSRVSDIDTHNNLYRYHWAIHLNGTLALQGFDVTKVAGGRVCRVLGFFGELPVNRRI